MLWTYNLPFFGFNTLKTSQIAFFGFVAVRSMVRPVDVVNRWFLIRPRVNPAPMVSGERQEPRKDVNPDILIFYRLFALALVYNFSVGEA